ncbi:MAG: hypothetical protein LBT20_05670 [Clostridiales bacterium]|jgi:hypothetical protein|nr:hypothetical protein [Clostridiales bacterium]
MNDLQVDEEIIKNFCQEYDMPEYGFYSKSLQDLGTSLEVVRQNLGIPENEEMFAFIEGTILSKNLGRIGVAFCSSGIFWKNDKSAVSRQTYLPWLEFKNRVINDGFMGSISLGKGDEISCAFKMKSSSLIELLNELKKNIVPMPTWHEPSPQITPVSVQFGSSGANSGGTHLVSPQSQPIIHSVSGHTCYYHRNASPVGKCEICGRNLCRECFDKRSGVCENCVADYRTEKNLEARKDIKWFLVGAVLGLIFGVFLSFFVSEPFSVAFPTIVFLIIFTPCSGGMNILGLRLIGKWIKRQDISFFTIIAFFFMWMFYILYAIVVFIKAVSTVRRGKNT